MSEGYVRCLRKAVGRTRNLFEFQDGVPDAEHIHAVKSLLYAAIERAWMESERLLGIQRMLRELLMLTGMHGDSKSEDREQAIRILARWMIIKIIGMCVILNSKDDNPSTSGLSRHGLA